MADTRKIKIEILNDVSNEVKDVEDEVNELSNKNTNAVNKKSGVKMMAQYSLHQFYHAAKNNIQRATDFNINRYFSLKDDYIGQNNYNQSKALISKAVSLGSSIAGGISTGVSMGGPVGGVVGAAVSATVWVANEAMNIYERYTTYYQTLNASDYKLSFSRERAGLVNEGRGTEN